MNNGLGLTDLITAVGRGKVLGYLGVSSATFTGWIKGSTMMPSKYLYMLKVRWPMLDLNRVALAMGEAHNRHRMKKGLMGLLG